MPLDLSTEVFDLKMKPNHDVAHENDTKFYSKYYLTGSSTTDSDIQTSEKNMKSIQFHQSLDIDRLKMFPKIVFLGTVSAIASSYRNNTSILVHTT